jgi:hypothetical protein
MLLNSQPRILEDSRAGCPSQVETDTTKTSGLEASDDAKGLSVAFEPVAEFENLSGICIEDHFTDMAEGRMPKVMSKRGCFDHIGIESAEFDKSGVI